MGAENVQKLVESEWRCIGVLRTAAIPSLILSLPRTRYFDAQPLHRVRHCVLP
jgi:hypothetical protein